MIEDIQDETDQELWRFMWLLKHLRSKHSERSLFDVMTGRNSQAEEMRRAIRSIEELIEVNKGRSYRLLVCSVLGKDWRNFNA